MNTLKKPKKILVAEDELSLRRPLAIRLKEEGYEVLEAEDGVQTLELSLKERPDIIILDILMPKMDGIAVLLALREDEWGKDAHVIILTNQTDMDRIAVATEHGAKEYIVKSDTSLEDIVKKIEAVTPLL